MVAEQVGKASHRHIFLEGVLERGGRGNGWGSRTRNLIALKRSILDYGRRLDLLHDESLRQHFKETEKEVQQRVREDQAQFL